MDLVIRSYPEVSYYLGESRKRWIYGTLSVFCQKVVFVEDNKVSSSSGNILTIPFKNVAKVDKAMTTFVFGAIVITLISGQAHWFSSLKDKESVFNLLNHFNQYLLLHREGDLLSNASVAQRTAMGTKLLHIAYESVASLAGAAVVLNQQGEKIDNFNMKMMDTHNDLDIADQLTSGLEKWLGYWSLQKQYKIIKPVIIKDNDIPQIYDYEILFTKIEIGKLGRQDNGVIQLSKSGLSILNLKGKLLHHFEWSNISKFRVISPWEMIMIRYQIGKPDISFSFVSSLLIDVLQKVHFFAKHKMEFETPSLSMTDVDSNFSQDTLSPVDKKLIGVRSQFKSKNISCQLVNELDITFGSSSEISSISSGTQKQFLKENQIVSDEEVQELSSTLKNLKSMMLAVGEETDLQNEKLDRVTESVDQANMKISDVNYRIHKLM